MHLEAVFIIMIIFSVKIEFEHCRDKFISLHVFFLKSIVIARRDWFIHRHLDYFISDHFFNIFNLYSFCGF